MVVIHYKSFSKPLGFVQLNWSYAKPAQSHRSCLEFRLPWIAANQFYVRL